MTPADPHPADWVLAGRAVFTPGGLRPAAVVVRGGRVAAVADTPPPGLPVVDAGENLVLPGLVDVHVHVNEPGRTEWEGFDTATRAAAAGGVTTVIDMPLNCRPVTTTAAALAEKRAAADGKVWVDVGFHGGVVPGNAGEIAGLIAGGVCAFKAFLCHSGIDDFPNATEADLRAVMPQLAAAGLPLLVHAERVGPLPPGIEGAFAANPRSYAAYLVTRPPEWEVEAVSLMIRLCREFRCPVHIVHLSAAIECRPLIEAAKAEGLPLTVETCPHYLRFAAEDLPDGDPRFKCAPPIRGRSEQAILKAMLADRTIDTIGSDHSPAPPELKHLGDGNLRAAWGGIASLQLLLPAAYRALGGLPLEALTSRPADLVGLGARKGRIAPGYDADLVVVRPESWRVNAAALFHRHKPTPYDGQELSGVVDTTYLRGRPVYHRGAHLGGPAGALLGRPPTPR